MQKLLILGSSRGSTEIVKHAKSRGIYTIVTDNYELSKSEAKQNADEYWMVSTADLDILERKCKENDISGIICGVSEFNIDMAIQLCKRLDLPFYCSEEAWLFSRDKAAFKELCRSVNANVPEDYYFNDEFSDEDFSNVKYPVVVKPIDSCASQGVSYCYNKEELLRACEYARGFSKSKRIVVERMLRGKELYVTYAMAEGEVSLLAVHSMNEQDGYPSYCCSVATTVSDIVKRFCVEANPMVESVLKKVGCKEGVAWVQVMLDADGKFYLIEMGYRLGGEMIAIPFKDMCGFDMIGWLVDYALGIQHTKFELPESQKCGYEKCACAYVLWTKDAGKIIEVKGLNELEKIPQINIDITMNNLDIQSKYRQLGVITFCTNDCAEMCDVLQQVNEKLKVMDENGKDIFLRYDKYEYLQAMYDAEKVCQ